MICRNEARIDAWSSLGSPEVCGLASRVNKGSLMDCLTIISKERKVITVGEALRNGFDSVCLAHHRLSTSRRAFQTGMPQNHEYHCDKMFRLVMKDSTWQRTKCKGDGNCLVILWLCSSRWKMWRVCEIPRRQDEKLAEKSRGKMLRMATVDVKHSFLGILHPNTISSSSPPSGL